ncbi:MAG: M28 family peptidase, partial [Myxococcota bacterium]
REVEGAQPGGEVALSLTVETQEIRVLNDIPTHNLEVIFPGQQRPEEIVLIGAHYDTVTLSPGADDNASGVAALLEIARTLSQPDASALDRTVRLVFFVNEEAPFYQDEGMGSIAYARRSRARGEQLVGVLSLDMLGYYDDRPGTQRSPPIYRWLHWPGTDAGNFLLIIGGFRARPFVQQAVGLFRDHTAMPCRGIAAEPEWAGSDRSDHWSFHVEGYPGAVVTDTGVARNPHYHQQTDTLDTLDLNRLARVTAGLVTVTQRLATLDPSR